MGQQFIKTGPNQVMTLYLAVHKHRWTMIKPARGNVMQASLPYIPEFLFSNFRFKSLIIIPEDRPKIYCPRVSNQPQIT